MSNSLFVALDLGAESGRGVLGRVGRDKLELTEVHRFPNGPVRTLDELHWDALRLWSEMKRATALAVEKAGDTLAGIGIDTWGVDFALLAKDDSLLGNPFHYRDAHTNGILDRAFSIVGRAEIFQHTGVQFMQFNTIFQLLAMKLAGSPVLEAAHTMLTMPDLFNFWFTGRKCCEFSNATTTQAYDPKRRQWSWKLIEQFGLPSRIFPTIVQPGTILGPLRPEVAEETGAGSTPLIAPAQHDTGSAVAAIPAAMDRPWAFLSSGTWSLMGMEVREPIIHEQSMRYNFTNEGGVAGTFRFLKNIMGLWLVQECRRTWERAGKAYTYDELEAMAAAAPPFVALLDPDDPSFLSPGDMPSRIVAFCKKTGQSVPDGPGSIIRTCMESLSLTYRQTLERITACTGQEAEVIHIVGGGTKNKVLCQWAADATGKTVIAGPVEATAAGNIIMQAIATGLLPDIAHARQLLRNSFEVAVYEPADTARWNDAYGRFSQLRS